MGGEGVLIEEGGSSTISLIAEAEAEAEEEEE